MRSLSTSIGIHALALAMAVAASAQAGAQNTKPTEHQERLAALELQKEMGQFAEEYWEKRLDGYKERIDKALLPDDLAALNRLRIRAMLFSNMASQKQTLRLTDDTDHRIDDAVQEGMTKMLATFTETKALAERYRPEMDRVGADVVDDLLSFVEALGERMERFAAKHPELSGAGTESLVRQLKMVRQESGSDELLAIYSIAIEPAVLLYDKGNMAGMFNQTVGTLGVTLPENAALRQNIPNPASSVTKIPYVLAEPSISTTLRLFDARGDIQGTYDLGSLAAGEHAFDLDVSGLPTGSYLYHLTVGTGSGQRVYVKAMQVVH